MELQPDEKCALITLSCSAHSLYHYIMRQAVLTHTSCFPSKRFQLQRPFTELQHLFMPKNTPPCVKTSAASLLSADLLLLLLLLQLAACSRLLLQVLEPF